MAATLNLPVRPGRVIEAGEDYAVVLGPWRHQDGRDYDLSGLTFAATVRDGASQHALIVATDPAAGTVTLGLPADVSAVLSARSDLVVRLIRADGRTRTLFRGTVLVGR